MAKTSRFIVLFSMICCFAATQAQVVIDADPQIEEELRMKNGMIDSTKMSGFRIQIAFNSDKSIVWKAKSRFVSLFPKYSGETYVSYEQPYWKLRVGNFYREIDAQELLDDIRKRFPNAFIVRDEIRLPRID